MLILGSSLATAENLSQTFDTITIDGAMGPYRIRFSLVRLNLVLKLHKADVKVISNQADSKWYALSK